MHNLRRYWIDPVPISMSLRTKALLLVGTMAALLIILLFALSNTILLDSFTDLEEDEVRQDTARVTNTIRSNFATMTQMALDWAQWDDSYRFVQDRNTRFLNSNLGDETLTTLDIDLLLFFDLSGEAVFGKAVDPTTDQTFELMPWMVRFYLAANSSLKAYVNYAVENDGGAGFILTPAGPTMLAVQPILPSDGAGEARGVLVIGRYLNSERLAQLAQITAVDFSLLYMNDPNLPANYREATNQLLDGAEIVTEPLSSEMFAGYALLEGVFGEPMWIMRVEMPRDITREGQAVIGVFLVASAALALVLIGSIAGVIERVVLARLIRFGAAVHHISQTGDLKRRVPVSGNDELADLGYTMNDMLAAFERSQDALRASQEQLGKLFHRADLRAAELATVAAISQQITTIFDVDALLWTVSNLIKEEFGFYHVHIYLLEGDTLKLAAGAGEIGRQLVERGIAIPVGSTTSVSARAARLRETVRVNDVSLAPDFLFTDLLKDTRSELAVPMIVGGKLVGVLNIEHDQIDRFSAEDTNILSSLTAQVAIAVHNARLFTDNLRRLAIIENMRDMIALTDIETLLPLYVNPAALESLGYERAEEFLSKSIEHLYPGKARERFQHEALPTAKAQGMWRGENEIQRQDGTTFAVEQAIFIISDEKGQPRDLATILTDITARRQAELALREANRAYQVLSDCNQAMVRASDEDHLLQEICRIIVNTGHYRFAWVNYVEDYVSLATYPVAHAGYEAGYLAAIKSMRRDHPETPPGPSQRAIRTNQSQVVHDIGQDPLYFPWREATLARGYRSMIALPLSSNGQSFGSLNVYATEPESFDDQEVALLNELASDLAYGITALRTRLEHQHALAQLQEANSRLEKRHTELLALQDIAQSLTSTLDIQQIYTVIYREVAQRLLGAQHVVIALYDQENEQIVCAFAVVDGELFDPTQLPPVPFGNGPNSETIRTRQPRIVALPTAQNKVTLPGTYTRVGSGPDSLASLYLPLISGNEVLGVLNIQHNEADAFQDIDMKLMTIIANQAAVAIRNAQLYSAEHEQRQFAETLRDVAVAVNLSLDLDEVLTSILANIRRVVPHDAANIMLIQGDTARVVRSNGYAAYGLEDWIQQMSFTLADQPMLRTIIETHQPVITGETDSDPDWDYFDETAWVHAFACVPILYKETVIGFLNVYSTTSGYFTPLHAERLQAFANQAALAIDNARLFAAERDQRRFAQALSDMATVLTGLFSLDEVVDQVLDHIQRVVPHDAANVMLVDLDEKQGHIIGGRGYEAHREKDHHRVSIAGLGDFEPGQSIVINNTASDPRWVDLPQDRWIGSYLGTPIHLSGQIVGLLNLDSVAPDNFTPAHAGRVQAFADQAALAIRSAQLFERVQRHAAELEQRVHERTQEVEQQRAQLQAILDSMGEGVIYDEKLRVKYTNRALTQLTGHLPAEFVEHPYLEPLCRTTHTPEEQAKLIDAIYSVVDQKGIWRGEARLQRRDGMVFDAALTATSVRNAAGEIIGAVTVIRDISQEKKLQEQRVRFIANASHELRTPLANIKTRLYLLQHQPERVAQHQSVLTQVADNMAELVENLLDVSRFERGVIPLNRKVTTLQDLIRAVTDVQQAEADGKKIDLAIHLHPLPLRALLDPRRIIQVITNLVSNAINYTPEGGRITVELTEESDQAVLRVCDTGIGIAPDMLAHVFDPFFRADEKVSVGTGLGLTIAREIVQLHGGQITVESTCGEGSVFTVRLNLLTEDS